MYRALDSAAISPVTAGETSSEPASKRFGFRADIEGLRALAVGAVIAFHFGVPGLPGGFLGVDVFFVISGYLITGLLTDEISRTGRIDFLQFYARRARRLLPIAFVVLVATLATGALILAPAEQDHVTQGAAAASLYASNIWLLFQRFDYFAPESALNPFLHTWSLAVEEQFYFVWPLLLQVGASLFRVRNLPWLIAAFTLASFVACIIVVGVWPPVAFYASPTRAWEFGIGALAFLVPLPGILRRPIPARILAWTGLAVLAACIVVMSERNTFPSWSALLPVFATAALLAAGGASDGRALGLLSSPIAQFLGKRSYALYLWHWPIIVFAQILKPELTGWERLACGALTLALATASLRLIERPLRLSPSLMTRPRTSLVLGVGISLAGALVALGGHVTARRIGNRPEQRLIVRAAEETPLVSSTPSCMQKLEHTRPTTCAFNTTATGPNVVLLGDSHAAQWFTPLEALARERNLRLTAVLKSSCAVADVPVFSTRLRREFSECYAWRKAAIDQILAARPAMVILSEHAMGYVISPTAPDKDDAAMVDAAVWGQGLKRVLKRFSDAGIPVTVIADTPRPGFNIPTCLGRAQRRGHPLSSCDVKASVATNADLAIAEGAAVADLPHATRLDLTPQFCGDGTCPAMRQDHVLYRDANHISEGAAIRLKPALERMLGPGLDAATR